MASVLGEQFYNVKTTESASVAFSMIQEGDGQFDLVMADINMREIDIFTFLNRLLVKMDTPIILMSVDENRDMAWKALNEGACFVLQKPIRRQDIINVWQHVYRKRTISQKIENRIAAIGKKVAPKKDSYSEKVITLDTLCTVPNENLATDGREKSSMEVAGEFGRVWENQARKLLRKAQILKVEMGYQGASNVERANNDSYGRTISEEISDWETYNSSEGVKSIEDGSERKDSDNGSPKKRSRMKWTASLHLKFIDAVSSLRDGKANPISILRKMNEPKLTVSHVATHLQKFRDRVNRINSVARSPVLQPNMAATPYNFNSTNGFIAGIPDGGNGSSMAGPNGTNLIGAGQNDELDQHFLGFDWSTQNFTEMSHEPDYSRDWTDMYQFPETNPDVPQQLLGPFYQDMNPPLNHQLNQAATNFFEGQSSNSCSVPDSSSFPKDFQATNHELNGENPTSSADLGKPAEGDQERVNGKLNVEPSEIGDDDLERFLGCLGSSPCPGNDFPK